MHFGPVRGKAQAVSKETKNAEMIKGLYSERTKVIENC